MMKYLTGYSCCHKPKIYYWYSYYRLVGFGLACAPVRGAHPSFWAHCLPKRGGAWPPTRPSQLWSMRSPAPRPAHHSFADPSGNILWSKTQNYVPVRPYALLFPVFLFYIFWIFSFCYSLLFLFSPFQFLLILLFISFSSYLFLFFSKVLFCVFFFFSFYTVLNCLLY